MYTYIHIYIYIHMCIFSDILRFAMSFNHFALVKISSRCLKHFNLKYLLSISDQFISYTLKTLLRSRCFNGYYGQPGVPGGSCQPCDCNDNLDLSVSGSCDPITGQCLRCRQGYSGATCDSCAEGFYGDAVTAKNCQRK